jgi:hypothetical protein
VGKKPLSRRRGDRRRIDGPDPAKNSPKHFEPVRRELSASLVGDQFERDFVALAQFADTGALYGADMDEGVFAAIVRRNEAEAFFGVKPLHGSLGHGNPFSKLTSMLAS